EVAHEHVAARDRAREVRAGARKGEGRVGVRAFGLVVERGAQGLVPGGVHGDGQVAPGGPRVGHGRLRRERDRGRRDGGEEDLGGGAGVVAGDGARVDGDGRV